MGGPDVQHRGGQSIFLHTLMDIYIFFLQGPRPPQGTTWLRPCEREIAFYLSSFVFVDITLRDSYDLFIYFCGFMC